MKEEAVKKYTLKEKFASLGPGILIVGSFIGPGTITSSTRAGANYGFALLWCIVFSVIAVPVLQEIAARLGVVKQHGLCEALLDEVKGNNFLRWALLLIVAVPIALGGFAYMGGDLTGTALGLSAITGIIMAAQAVNGVFLPVSVGVVVWLTSRSSVMGKYKNSALSNVLGIGVFIISLIIGVNSVISLF